jgi:hypothetical protein
MFRTAAPPMRFRKLRIAWSVFWGVAAVLLIVLWVHSYWYQDYIRGNLSRSWSACWLSFRGWVELDLIWEDMTGSDPSRVVRSEVNFCRVEEATPATSPERHWRWASNTRNPWMTNRQLIMPIWCPLLASAAAAMLPWVRWSKRFTLRTLLIATTLVAVILGLVVYAAS